MDSKMNCHENPVSAPTAIVGAFTPITRIAKMARYQSPTDKAPRVQEPERR